MYITNYSRRTKAAFLAFFVILFLSLVRLFYIQFFRSQYLSEIANKQHTVMTELQPRRGTIYDTNLRPQAVNLVCDSVYLSPNEVPEKEKGAMARLLAKVLKIEEDFVLERLSRKKSFVWLVRKITPEQSEALVQMKLKGVGFLKESKRCYPNMYLASQIIGFSDIDNTGLEGLERHYDRYLKGEPGWVMLFRDARAKKLDIYDNALMPKDGSDIVLTIDEVIQYIAERELDKAYRLYRAKGASIVVMNPRTGEILALANRPNFDPNDFTRVTKDQIRNRVVCDMFEPGSVFKIVTAAAALEQGAVSEEDRFFCENGAYKVANHILHDHKPHGWLTFREVVEQSSNIGFCKVAQKLGAQQLQHYIKLFGFGIRTGVDLPGEINGQTKDISAWSKTSISAIPMGQEVGVTSLQLACAISTIANGGKLMKPYIVRQVRDRKGEVIKEFSPTVVRECISSDTAGRVRKLLIGVVENGTGKMAKSQNFTCGGKTGTAQKLEPNGRYSHSKFMASFIGFAPANDPELAIVVTVDEPRGYYFGGVVSAPVFKNVAQDVLLYLKTNRTYVAENISP